MYSTLFNTTNPSPEWDYAKWEGNKTNQMNYPCHMVCSHSLGI